MSINRKDLCDIVNQIYHDTCLGKVPHVWNMTQSTQIAMEYGKRSVCLDAIKLKLSECHEVIQTTVSHSKASLQ